MATEIKEISTPKDIGKLVIGQRIGPKHFVLCGGERMILKTEVNY